jgi:hypothetical protein
MPNQIEMIQEYASDIWPVHNLYEVGQLIYVLRNMGDTELAGRLEEWKSRMETRIHAEFSQPQEAV